MTDHPGAKPGRPGMSARGRMAMALCQRLAASGSSMGTRRIVSMQGAEQAGLVERVTPAGMIVDWKLTKAGMEWRE